MPTLGLNPSQWYWVAGLAFLLLGLQALLGSSRLMQWHRLGLAGAGLAWSGYHALGAAGSLGAWSVAATLLVELLFQFAWFALLYRALRGPYLLSMPETVRRGLQAYWATVVVGAVIVSWIAAQDVLPAQAISPLLTLSAALACLALAAQLYRDAPLELSLIHI